MAIYMEEYKGFSIIVTEDRQAHYTARYIAKAMNGSDWACGESVESAVRHLKHKIDNIDTYQSIYTRPLEESELNRLISFLRGSNGEMRVRLKLQRNHFFTQRDFVEIGIRAIINHTDVIQRELNNQGNKFQLACAQLTIGCDLFCAVYDCNYFDTSKISQLEEILQKLGFDN